MLPHRVLSSHCGPLVLGPGALPLPRLQPDPGPGPTLQPASRPHVHRCPLPCLPGFLPPEVAACPSQKCTLKGLQGFPPLHTHTTPLPSAALCPGGVTRMAYLVTHRQQLLRRRVGTRNSSSTDWWALAEATSSFMLDISTSGKNRATVRVGAVGLPHPHAREWAER